MEPFDIQFGEREAWGGAVPLGLFRADRRRHTFLVGQTGTGKSTLIRELIAQDIESGEGCAIIDPHGDLAREVLERIPPSRIDDVVILDPSDTEFPVALNPFYRVPKDERSLVAANIVSTMKHIWRDSWGPRLEHILYNTVAAILDAPDHLRPTMLSIPLVLVRADYRERIVQSIVDPQVRSFFIDEFGKWNERQLAEYLSSVQNKIGQFLSNPFIRNILGQWRPAVDLHHIVESRKICIVSLSKGTLGEGIENDVPFGRIAETASLLMQLEALREKLAGLAVSKGIPAAMLSESLALMDNLTRAGVSLNVLRALSSEDADVSIEGLRSWARESCAALVREKDKRAEFTILADIDVNQLTDCRDFEAAPLALLQERLRRALSNPSSLAEQLDLQRALAIACGVTPSQFVERLVADPPSSEQAKAAYDWLLYRALAKTAFNLYPDLVDFNGLDLQAARENFQRLDREILKLEREKIRATLCAYAIPFGNGVGRKSSFTDRALIINELSKKKRHIPLRQLFLRAAGAIKKMKPCFMMSPLSVATYLKAGQFEFDVAVIDEASQMPLEDALGIIARSNQIVVVGDPMQLPPTTFTRVLAV